MYFGYRQFSWNCYQPYNPCPRVVFYVPVACTPVAECCARGQPMRAPHDLEVQPATSPQQALVGGHDDVYLTLEYLVESGATAPEVKLTMTSGSTTSTWDATNIAEGYHVREAFMFVKPGTKVTVATTNVTARLRWCETICC